MPRARQMPATNSQSRGSPRVGPYCSATARLSRITCAAISAIRSAGNVSGLGTPPANEMMFGSLISFAKARIAEGRKFLRIPREEPLHQRSSVIETKQARKNELMAAPIMP